MEWEYAFFFVSTILVIKSANSFSKCMSLENKVSDSSLKIQCNKLQESQPTQMILYSLLII
jgi:hypothetical protein